MEQKIQHLMHKLNISREEALQLISDDKAIDQGANLFPLTKEQEKASKKARSAGRAPTIYKFDNKKPRKPNEDKRNLINALNDTIRGLADAPSEVVNPEREILFQYNGAKYKIVLSAPRK